MPLDPGPLSLAMAQWAARAGLRDALWKHCTGITRTCNATTMHHSSPLGGVQPARGTGAVSWPRPEGAAQTAWSKCRALAHSLGAYRKLPASRIWDYGSHGEVKVQTHLPQQAPSGEGNLLFWLLCLREPNRLGKLGLGVFIQTTRKSSRGSHSHG